MVRITTSLSSDHPGRAAGARRAFGALLLLSAAPAVAAEPVAAPDAKESLAQLRDYLPTIRHKVRLDAERDHAAKLKRQLQLYERYLEGGMASQPDKGEIEDALLQSQRRVLQRDRKYQDSRDEFALRFRLPVERLRKMEEASVSPLTTQFQGFEILSRDYERVAYEVLASGGDKDVTKVRAALVRNLTASALVKNTALPKRFREHWDRLQNLREVETILDEKRKERDELRARLGELVAAKRQLPGADLQRFEEVSISIDWCHLSRDLLTYERRPWETSPERPEREWVRGTHFSQVMRSFRFVVDQAWHERLGRLSQSWPSPAPVRLQEVDLLTADPEKAEQMAVSLVRTPEAQLSVKKKVRRLRELAEGYQKCLQRSYYIGYLRRENIFNKQRWPSSSPDKTMSGLVGPVAERPHVEPVVAGDTLRAEALYAKAKRQLLLTWIDYEAVRLDLYHDLGVPPP